MGIGGELTQGRRHGFESGGGQILRAKRTENFFDPPLFGQWKARGRLPIRSS